jgi:predicted porin
MKKSLLAAAVLSAVSFGAQADGVELYGILDAGVATVSESLNIDPFFPSTINVKGGAKSSVTQSVTGLVSGVLSGSRWGIKGSEDMGDGLKAIFTLESGIDIGTGNLVNGQQSRLDGSSYSGNGSSSNGQLFGRQAWVGLKDAELGEVRLGRNYSLMFDVYGEYGIVQNAQLLTPTGNSGSVGGGAGATENLRLDNSVKYIGKTGDINYSAVYKFGNIAGSTSQGSVYSARLGYEKGAFGVQAVYMGSTDTVTTNTINPGYSAVLVNTSAYLVAAKYKFNDTLTGKINYQRYNLQNPSDSTVSGSTSYYGYNLTSVTARTLGSGGVSVASAGVDYRYSDKLGLYAGYTTINYDANGSKPEGGNLSFSEQYASLLLDYNLSNRTDVYLGGMQVTTGQSGYQGLNVIAAGMRHKF